MHHKPRKDTTKGREWIRNILEGEMDWKFELLRLILNPAGRLPH
jgi:hypothetical protein